MAWKDEEKEFRDAGFSDDEINAEKTRLSGEMASNGFSRKEIDSFFGEGNPSKKRASKAESALAGAAQTTTWGYAPNIVGALSDVAGSAQGIPKEALNYIGARDKTARDIKEAEKENPWYYKAGQGVGVIGAAALAPAALTATLGRAGLSAALSGALYNPGEKEGEFSGAQIPERTAAGVVSGIAGAGGKLAGDTINKLARAYATRRAMNSQGFGQGVQKQVRDAIDSLYEKYISPRSNMITEELKNSEISFRPDILKGTKTKQLRKALEDRMDEDFKVSLRGDKAERLRRLMDAKAGYSNRNALANPKVAKSGELQKSAADILRAKRNEAFPQLKPTFDEESYALGLAKEFADKSQSPQSLLTSGFWGDVGSKVTDIDKMAGTDLKGLGEDIMRARWLQGAPGQPVVNQIPGMNELLRRGAVAGGAASEYLAPLQNKGVSPGLMKLLMDAKYRASYNDEDQ